MMRENVDECMASVLKEMRLSEECLKKWGLTWDEVYSDAICDELFKKPSKNKIDYLTKRYNGKYELKEGFPHAGPPLINVTLLDGDYDAKREPIEYNVGFRKISWKNINSHSSEREMTFYNTGWIDYEKHSTLEKYDFYSFFAQYNAYTKEFRIIISRNYVADKMERIDVVSFENLFNNLEINLNGIGKLISLKDMSEIIVNRNDVNIDSDKLEEIINKSKEMVNRIKSEIPIHGLIESINMGLTKLSNSEQKNGNKK